MERELRAGEEGVGNDTKERNFAHHHFRVPDGQKNDLGDEQSTGGPIPVRKSRGRETAEGVPLFIGYSAAVYFHTCDIMINSWTTQAKKMRGSMPPKFEVRDILRTLDQAELENLLPVWDDERMIVEEGHIALKDDMKFATRKYRAPYGQEQVEMKREEKELDAVGSLYVALSENKKLDPATPSPLSVGNSWR